MDKARRNATRDRRDAAAWVLAATQGTEPQLGSALLATLDRLAPRLVLELASAHGVAPWVVAALDAAERRDSALASGLREFAMRQALQGLQLDHELTGLLASLEVHSVPSILLKGPSVAHRYYSRPELRPYGDLDLLIRERDEHQVRQVLHDRGYAQTSGETRDPLHHEHAKFQATFSRPDGSVIDLHLDHLQIGLRPLSLEDVWHRAVPSPWGQGVRLLEPEDQFVLLAVHLQRHNFDRLVWFKDLDLMVRRGELDWARVAEVARLEGCESTVGYAITLLVDVLATPLPMDARRLAAARGPFTRTMQRLLWPRGPIVRLERHRRWRLRRAVQFAPESGLVRGGLPSLLTWGRRGAKARVLLSAIVERRGKAS